MKYILLIVFSISCGMKVVNPSYTRTVDYSTRTVDNFERCLMIAVQSDGTHRYYYEMRRGGCPHPIMYNYNRDISDRSTYSPPTIMRNTQIGNNAIKLKPTIKDR